MKEKEKTSAKDRIITKIKEEESNDSTSVAEGTDPHVPSNLNVKIVIGIGTFFVLFTYIFFFLNLLSIFFLPTLFFPCRR